MVPILHISPRWLVMSLLLRLTELNSKATCKNGSKVGFFLEQVSLYVHMDTCQPAAVLSPLLQHNTVDTVFGLHSILKSRKTIKGRFQRKILFLMT